MSISISRLSARQILDSRGNPTVEADVILSDGSCGRASVPSGASTGQHEAVELRDNEAPFGGTGVTKAVRYITTDVASALVGRSPFDQSAIDQLLCDLDGTFNKSRLGANAILAVSLATAKAAATSRQRPLYRYVAELAGTSELSLPLPMMNIMNGGAHANFSTDIQEYMIIAHGAKSFGETLEIGAAIFHTLGGILRESGYATTVGDEGGYAPLVRGGNREPLELIMQAITAAGYTPGVEVSIALDVAASEFAHAEGYRLRADDATLPSPDMIDWLDRLAHDFPIISIEDGLGENDWDNWPALTKRLGKNLQLVGDDLLVTNTTLLERAIHQTAGNAILIKPNQIGTLTETIDAVRVAKRAGWRTIMSHRSGETEDTTIAHLAVGLGTRQIKTGSLSRTDRIAKYNELLRIAESDQSLKMARPFTT